MNPYVLKSAKNKQILVHNSFVYQLHSTYKDRIYWRCHDRKYCDARCSTNANLEAVYIKTDGTKKHLHAPDVASVEVRRFLVELKARASTRPNEGATEIVRDAVGPIANEEVLARIPERNALRRLVNRTQNQTRPRLPLALEDIDIPRQYRSTVSGQRFLMYDSGIDDENRILIFTTVQNMEKLVTSMMLFTDGTFKIVPRQFLQLMTVHGEYRGYCFPFAYVLSIKKDEQTYRIVYQELKNFAVRHHLRLEPRHMMSDFELANINACREEFPDADLHCCLFHFEQSLWRNIVERNLVASYKNIHEPLVRNSLLAFMGLPFIPVADIFNVFDLLYDEAPLVVQEFADYIDETYVTGKPATHRRPALPPRYPPRLWSVYELTLNGIHRTNNVVESFHSKYQKMVKTHHLSIWKFLDYMRRDQNDTEQLCTQLDLEHTRIRQQISKKSRENQERIERRVRRYQEFKEANEIPRYLRGIAYYIRVSDEPAADEVGDSEDE